MTDDLTADLDPGDGDVRALLSGALPAALPAVPFEAVAARARVRRRQERIRRAVGGSVLTAALSTIVWTALSAAPLLVPSPDGPGTAGTGGVAPGPEGPLVPDVGQRLAALAPLGTVVAVAAVAVLLAGLVLPRRLAPRPPGGRVPPPGAAAVVGLASGATVGAVLHALVTLAAVKQDAVLAGTIRPLTLLGSVGALVCVGAFTADGWSRFGRFPSARRLAIPVALLASGTLTSVLVAFGAVTAVVEALTRGAGSAGWPIGRFYLALAAVAAVVFVVAATSALRTGSTSPVRPARAAGRCAALVALMTAAQTTAWLTASEMIEIWRNGFEIADPQLLALSYAVVGALCGWALIGAGRSAEPLGIAEPDLGVRPSRPRGVNPTLRLLRVAPQVLALVTAMTLGDLVTTYVAPKLDLVSGISLIELSASTSRVLIRLILLALVAWGALWLAGRVSRPRD